MARKRDPLKAFTFPNRKTPLRSGGGRRTGRESAQQFIDRVASKDHPKSMTRVITAVEGSIPLAALYYDMDEGFIKDVIDVHKHCKEAWLKARAVRAAREKNATTVADILKREAEDAVAKMPTLPSRERWPVDDTARRHAIRDWLLDEDVLVLYEGDLVKISEAGTVPMHVLLGIMDGDEVLQAQRELGLRVRAERAASRMMELSETSSQPTATDKLLKAFGDDRWRDRSQVDVRRVGFEPPASSDDDDGELASVLRRVK